MPGPTPSPNPRRRNPRPGVVVLPRDGYGGPVPEWPLAGRHTNAEQAAWSALWRLPQGYAWAELSLDRTVALYVRALVRAERPDATASLLGTVRQFAEGLGLTAMAMLRLRWEIEAAATPSDEPAGDGEVASLEDRRRRVSGA